MLTIAVSPSPPPHQLCSICFILPLFFNFTPYLPTSPSYCAVSIIFSTSLQYHPSVLLLCLPCSMRHQVGSATLGCRAALRASSATACLRVRGPGPSLQTSMKPCIIWTGCCRVSLWHTSMKQWMCLLGVMRNAPLFSHF